MGRRRTRSQIPEPTLGPTHVVVLFFQVIFSEIGAISVYICFYMYCF